jgi:ribosomal protein S18 acetylase RimI-like enzyme
VTVAKERRVKPTIRIANPADAAAISGLLRELTGELLPPDDLARRMAKTEGQEIVFLAQGRNRPAGLLVLQTEPFPSNPTARAEITELCVHPAERRQGVGRALVDTAVAFCRAQGHSEILLWVDPANTTGLVFYQALGFQQGPWEMRKQIDDE